MKFAFINRSINHRKVRLVAAYHKFKIPRGLDRWAWMWCRTEIENTLVQAIDTKYLRKRTP